MSQLTIKFIKISIFNLIHQETIFDNLLKEKT